MSQAQVEKFFAFAARVRQQPGRTFKGTIVGIEYSGDELIKAAVAKGKELGYEFTPEEATAWIRRQLKMPSGPKLSNSEVDQIADVFGARDKFLEDKH